MLPGFSVPIRDNRTIGTLVNQADVELPILERKLENFLGAAERVRGNMDQVAKEISSLQERIADLSLSQSQDTFQSLPLESYHMSYLNTFDSYCGENFQQLPCHSPQCF